MAKITDILKDTAHRPYELPKSKWNFYQEWKQVLFFHWVVPEEILKPLIPHGLDLDFFDGRTYISLVPFTMNNIRPRYFPAMPHVSYFHEVNLRAYVIRDGIPGVYFLSIEAQNRLSAFISRKISGLPYEYAIMFRENGQYRSANPLRKFMLEAEFSVGSKLDKSAIEKWLTERYALFLEERGNLYRFDIHHKEWEIKSIELKKLKLDYQLQGLNLADKQPDLVHYSDGVEVIAWNKIPLS